MYDFQTFPAASYDAWKTRTPWDDYEPRHCETCGASEEDCAGPEWDRDWVGGGSWEHLVIVPYGRCQECGWRCEPCPDIEDLYERCGEPVNA